MRTPRSATQGRLSRRIRPAYAHPRLERLEDRNLLDANAVSPLTALPAAPAYDPHSILVHFRPGAAALDAADILAGTSNGKAFSQLSGLRSIRLGEGVSVASALAAFQANPNVLYAEPNYIRHVDVLPNDTSFGELYGLHNTGQSGGTADADIDAPEAWNIATGSSSIVVGVIDTGVDYTHPDLAANIWTNPGEIAGNGRDDDNNGFVDDVHGYDFVGAGDGDPMDDHYHGTHVAGTIGAVGDNNLGVVGVNWNVRIMALKFLDAGGSGTTADAIEAIDYATMMRNLYASSGGTRGANIVLTSNSWGGGGFSLALQDAIAASGTANMLFVAAAGNGSSDNDSFEHYPSSYPLDNLISVAATDRNDNLASFSNWGATSVDLAAPGVDTLSTTPGNTYSYLSGTSMATPHVAGVAALAWSIAGDTTYQRIRDAIFDSVDPISAVRTTGPTPVATGGRLNAFKTLQALGMGVVSSTPARDSVVSPDQPTDFVLNFSHPYDPATVREGGLTVNGIAATSLTKTDSDTVTFHFATPPAPPGVEGEWTMHLAAGALAATSASGLPDPLVRAWTAVFRYDFLPLQVVATRPDDGSNVALPLTTLELDFNEDVKDTSVGIDDLVLSMGSVTNAALLDSNTVRYTIAGLNAEGTLTVGLAAGALTDTFGNPGLSFTGTYTLDIGTVPYPGPMTPILPLGSLVYDPRVSAVIGVADTDSFTLNVDAGQTITVLVDPAATLKPTIELFDPADAPIVTVSALANGRDAVLQTITATTGGTYTISVSGADGTTGAYAVQVFLNAALELESHDGPANDTTTKAENIDGSAVSLGGSATRLAVIGSLGAAPVLVSEDFEGGALPASFTTASFTATGEPDTNGRIQVKTPDGSGNSSAFALMMDRTVDDGIYTLNESVWTVDLTGVTVANLGFSHVQINDESDFLPLDFAGHANGDGVAISDDGINWRTILNGPADASWTDFSIDLAAAAADAGMALGPNFQIKFQQYDNYSNPTDGRGYDNIVLSGASLPDVYSLSLAAGDSATVALKTLNGGTAQVSVLAPDGTLLAQSLAGGSNLDQQISNLAVATGGTYYLSVTGSAGTDYSLVVVRNADFDTENNDNPATARVLQSAQVAGKQMVLGHTTGGAADLFSLQGTGFTGSLVLTGSKITLGINDDGSFITGDGTGIRFLGNEFVFPGSPLASFTVSQDGANFTNNGANGVTEIAITSKEDLSSGSLLGVRIVGTVGGTIQMERVVVFNTDDEFATIATRLTNLSGATLSNVAWMENLDPDQGQPFTGDFNTANDVVLGGRFVRGDVSLDAFPGGLTIGLGSEDARGVVSAEGFDNRNPYDIITSPEDPEGTFGDIAIALAFDYGSLAPSASASSLLIMTFGRTTAEAESTYSDNAQGTQLADPDVYQITATSAGQVFGLATSTPADGTGEFVNTLDPRLRVLDAEGTELDSDDNSAADGRNALLTFRAPAAGTYYVEVSPSVGTINPTRGEYVLSVTGNTVTAPDFQVTATDPSDGSPVRNASTLTVDFNDAVLLSSVQASDLVIDGTSMTATGFTAVDGNTVRFNLPALAGGLHTLTLAEGSIADVQNTPLQAFSTSFTIDNVAPRVTATSIAPGGVLPVGAVTYTVTFSEAMNAGNLSADDFTLRGNFRGVDYSASSFSFDAAGTVLTLDYASLPEDDYTLTLFSGPTDGTRFTDAFGNALDGEFSGTFPSGNGSAGGDFAIGFIVDVGTQAFPALTAVAPLGSLIYRGSLVGYLQPATDTDDFTIQVDAGQTITVIVDPDATLRPTITLSGPLSGSATAPDVGKDAVLQTARLTTAGLYTISVGGAAGTGAYTIEVILGAAVENESHDGATNNTAATGQSINGSLIPLLKTATRGAVLGQTDASTASNTVYLATFESGTNGFVVGSETNNLWHRSTGRGSQSGHSSTTSFYFGQNESSGGGGNYNKTNSSGGTVRSQGTITSPAIILPAGQLSLDFNYVLQTQGSTSKDLALLEIKRSGSSTWTTLASYNAVAESNVWRASAPVDLSAYAGQTVQIRFRFDTVDKNNNAFEGWYVDDVRIQQLVPHDNYSFTVGTDQNVTVVLESLTGGDVNVVLQNAAGATTLATGVSGATNVDKAIYNYNLPGAGTYNLAIVGQVNTSYSLLVALDAVFDLEPNNASSQAQNMDGVVGSLGYLETTTASDWYSVTATAGQTLHFITTTPGDGGGEPRNDLNPHIELYNTSGRRVATGVALADGRNETIDYTATKAGVYRIRVNSEGSTTGEYFLDPIVSSTANPSPAADVGGALTARSARSRAEEGTAAIAFAGFASMGRVPLGPSGTAHDWGPWFISSLVGPSRLVSADLAVQPSGARRQESAVRLTRDAIQDAALAAWAEERDRDSTFELESLLSPERPRTAQSLLDDLFAQGGVEQASQEE